MPEEFKHNPQLASEAGKKSSRKGIANRRTQLYRAMVDRVIARKKNNQKPIVLEDFRQDNYEGLLELLETAQNFQEKYLIQSLIAKLLHTMKVEHTGKDGEALVNKITIEIVEKAKE